MGEEGTFGFDGPKVVTLREVSTDDLEKLREHRNQWDTRRWLERSHEIDQPTQRAWFENGGPYRRVLIAEDAGVSVGIARVDNNYGDTATVGCDTFAAYRGKGYGTAIFKAACDLAIARGAKHLSLWVFIDNELAVSIYKRAGFQFDHDAEVKQFFRPMTTEWSPCTYRAYVRMTKSV